MSRPRLRRTVASMPWFRSRSAKARMRGAAVGVRSGAPPGMQRQDVHQRAQPPRQLGQPIRVGVGVVHSPDHHVLEGHPLAERRRGLEHRLEVVLLLDRHDRAGAGRTSWRGARWRDGTAPAAARSAAIPGSIPTVETVMCRAPMPNPSGALRIVRAVSTASQLSSGSPMPMNTMLVGLSSGLRRTISRTCPAISNGVRLRR